MLNLEKLFLEPQQQQYQLANFYVPGVDQVPMLNDFRKLHSTVDCF